MSKLVMNIKNESNLKAMVEWCKQYHIDFQIIEDNNSMPNLVDDTVVGTVAEKPKSTKKSDFPSLGEKADETVGVITRYDKFVRNWEVGMDGKVGGFVMDKVKYATKKAITESGAKWNDEKKAYEFSKVADAKAFMKAQRDRVANK